MLGLFKIANNHPIINDETYTPEIFEVNNTSTAIPQKNKPREISTGLAIYKNRNEKTKKINLEKLNEISSNDLNADFYKNIKDKINLKYYLHLSKQLVDRVNKNIYDLTYLTDLSHESKNAISENLKENLDKFNKFFNMKFNQFEKEDDYDNLYSAEFSFLGRKRNSFISRNNFEENSKSQKNEGFLKFTNLEIDAKCFEPKGVKYSISHNENLTEENYDLLDIKDLNTNENSLSDDNIVNKINKETNHKYMNIGSSKKKIDDKRLNINLNDLSNNKSLISKYNNQNNPTRRIVTVSDIFDKKNQNINSLYCKEYIDYSQDNSEFFKRLFAKINRDKLINSMEDENFNINQDKIGGLENEKHEKISFTQKK